MIIRFLLIGLMAAGFALAQDDMGGGMGSGARGGGGGGLTPSFAPSAPSTLDRLAGALKLADPEKKNLKSTLDAAHREGEALRKQIPSNREQIALAVQAGKSPAEIQPLLDTQGAATAEMLALEMRTFTKIYTGLSADQKKASGQMLFNSMSGLFMKKNWNQ